MMIFLNKLVCLAQNIQRSVAKQFSVSRLAAVAGLAVCLFGLSMPAQAADLDYSENSKGAIQSTERYDNIRSKSGGMNNFDAADPRRNIGEATAKAQELSDVAKRRKMEANDPLETVREAVGSIKDSVGNSVDSAADELK